MAKASKSFHKKIGGLTKRLQKNKLFFYLLKLPKYLRAHLSSLRTPSAAESSLVYKNKTIYYRDWDRSSIIERLKSGKTYDEKLEKYIRYYLKPGNLALDIGSNIGLVSLLMSEIVGESGQVLSFEPEDTNFKLLSKNIGSNQVSNVRTYKTALSDREGTAKFFVDKLAFGTHSLARGSIKWLGEVQDVPTCKLDNLLTNERIKQKVDFIKIDTQGAEINILKGAKKILEQSRPVMVVEFWPHGLSQFGYTIDDFFKLVAELNYSIKIMSNQAGDKVERKVAKKNKHTSPHLSTEAPPKIELNVEAKLKSDFWPRNRSINILLLPNTVNKAVVGG